MDEVWTYKWTNVTWILHLFINLCVKCVFNAQYQCVELMNYEWTNFAWFPLLSREMLSLWYCIFVVACHDKITCYEKNKNKNQQNGF
jgi:hypothetical protein